MEHVGMTVCLKGWVQFNRKKFLILRDAYGTTQILLNNLNEHMQTVVDSLTLESVVEVRGEVVSRPKGETNTKMSTGDIEVRPSHISVLGAAPNQLPLFIRENKLPTEHLRMKYRYLYLRYPHMQKVLRFRSQLFHSMREFLIKNNFIDVETPTLFRKTPGGAQEFIVPTQNPGLFYSLVQSPQQFKQLLMVGGLDRYFQIARCYRDETVRHDRQPEFTQLDIELSFVDRNEIISLIEELLRFAWPSEEGKPSIPFPHMTFHDAMSNYGSDKPDLRFDAKIQDITHFIDEGASTTSRNLNRPKNFSAKLILFPNAADTCKKDQLNEIIKQAQDGAVSTQLHILPVRQMKALRSSLCKYFSNEEVDKIVSEMSVTQGDLLLLCLGQDKDVLRVLGTARVLTANCLEENGQAIRDKEQSFLWVVDFPLFEEGDDGSLQSAHHPFTQPHPEDLHLLDSDPLKVRGLHYDLVLNGAEIGGGSIRISDSNLQKHILNNMLKLDTTTLQHLVDALSFGCPPHGGIALGLDRLVSIMCGAKSIREVIAFPKGLEGKDSMAGAPAPLTAEDAKVYGLPFKY